MISLDYLILPRSATVIRYIIGGIQMTGSMFSMTSHMLYDVALLRSLYSGFPTLYALMYWFG